MASFVGSTNLGDRRHSRQLNVLRWFPIRYHNWVCRNLMLKELRSPTHWILCVLVVRFRWRLLGQWRNLVVQGLNRLYRYLPQVFLSWFRQSWLAVVGVFFGIVELLFEFAQELRVVVLLKLGQLVFLAFCVDGEVTDLLFDFASAFVRDGDA